MTATRATAAAGAVYACGHAEFAAAQRWQEADPSHRFVSRIVEEYANQGRKRTSSGEQRVRCELRDGSFANRKGLADGQDALANHMTIGPWIRGSFETATDMLAECQSIIREERLGDDLPY